MLTCFGVPLRQTADVPTSVHRCKTASFFVSSFAQALSAPRPEKRPEPTTDAATSPERSKAMIAAATHAAFWQSHSGHQFEHELAKLFTRDGYDTKVTRGSGDGGIDIILRRSGLPTVVQCKQTKSPIGPARARSLRRVDGFEGR